MADLKDFLYLDIDKIISLYSQLTGGLVKQVETSSSSSNDSRNIRKYHLALLEHEAGGIKGEAESSTETWISHHDLYGRLENELLEKGYLADIGSGITEEDVKSGKATQIFQNSFCVRAEGWAVLEDYERIKRISSGHNDIADFINNSIQSSLKNSEDYKNLKATMDSIEKNIKKIKGKNNIVAQRQKIKELKNQIDTILESAKVKKTEDWIKDGLENWIDTFLPGIFNARLYPFPDYSSFHIISNLKKDCFMDNDIEGIHYTYGSRPSVQLGMLGLITSVPKQGEHEFDPMKEFEGITKKTNSKEEVLEKAFRGVFRGFDGFEGIVRTCRYPRIMVYPVSLYRTIKPNKALGSE